MVQILFEVGTGMYHLVIDGKVIDSIPYSSLDPTILLQLQCERLRA